MAESNRKGDCYIAAFHLADRLSKENTMRLEHGIVKGQESLEGVRFGHAWVEIGGDIVLDFSNGQEVILRKDQYYKIGDIRTVHRYTFREMVSEAVRTGTYGPWDNKVDV